MKPQQLFGKNVRKHRAERGWSQERLADIADLHPTEVSRLERGMRQPRLGTIVLLARALGVRPSELLDGID